MIKYTIKKKKKRACQIQTERQENQPTQFFL